MHGRLLLLRIFRIFCVYIQSLPRGLAWMSLGIGDKPLGPEQTANRAPVDVVVFTHTHTVPLSLNSNSPEG